MNVREWMSPDPVTVAPSMPVAEARRLLDYYGIRHLPVVRSDRLVGIISDRDVRVSEHALRAVKTLRDLPAALGVDREVEDIMSQPVHTIGPDDTVETAARLLLSWRINAVPVVEDGRLVGLLTTTDCLLASLTPVEVGG